MTAALVNETHGLIQNLRTPAIPTVANNNHHCPTSRSRSEMLIIELHERTPDLSTSRPVDGHGLNPFPCFVELSALKTVGNPGKIGTEDEASRIGQGLLQSVHKYDKESVIDIHGTADIQDQMDAARNRFGAAIVKFYKLPSVSEGAPKAFAKIDFSNLSGYPLPTAEPKPKPDS